MNTKAGVDAGVAAGVDLVGVGLNATDTIIPVPEYPERGSKVTFRSANVLPGGRGGVGGGGLRDVEIADAIRGEGGERCRGRFAPQ